MTRFVLPLALLVLAAATLGLPSEARESAPAKPADVLFERDIEYAKSEHAPATLNLARPGDAASPRPCVVVIHGGGWASGRKEQHDDLIRVLAQEGFVAATISYGLCPTCPWPAQIHDVKTAVRYLRTHAKRFGIDTQRMAALGFSAGAHLAMLLGTVDPDDGLEGPSDGSVSSKVQAVVAFFGPTDMEKLADSGKTAFQRKVKREALNRLLGPHFAKDAGSMSPVRYVDAGDAPILIFQGTRDPLVPYDQAITMMETLHEAKVDAEITFLVGARHGWGDPLLAATVNQARHFLDRKLRPERVESFRARLREARR